MQTVNSIQSSLWFRSVCLTTPIAVCKQFCFSARLNIYLVRVVLTKLESYLLKQQVRASLSQTLTTCSICPTAKIIALSFTKFPVILMTAEKSITVLKQSSKWGPTLNLINPVHYRAQISPPRGSILNQTNQVHIAAPYFSKIRLTVIQTSMPKSSNNTSLRAFRIM